MADPNKTVFISYRREPSKYLAAYIYQYLKRRRYDVFWDVSNINNGAFSEIILSQIAARTHFIVVLAPSSLERCAEPGDWLRQEIERAMELERNIIPLIVDGFNFNSPEIKKQLTGVLANLSRYQALEAPYSFLEEAMERLHKRYLKPPEKPVIITPTPPSERAIVKEKIIEADNQPVPTEKQLSAEDYFNRAFYRDENDIAGKIIDYTEAIRLNPNYAAAYGNRGNDRSKQGDVDGAIADHTEVIRLNPQDATAYNNRGVARYNKGDLGKAIADYNEAIRLNPQDAAAYNNRGVARYNKGDLNGAIADYNEAIRLDPNYATAYKNRGTARSDDGDLDGAIADYSETIRLNPQNAGAQYDRGLARHDKGNLDGAIADYSKAIRLDPNYTRA